MHEDRYAAGLLLIGGRISLDFCNTIHRKTQPPHDFLAEQGAGWFVQWCADIALITPAEQTQWAALLTEQDALAQEFVHATLDLREALYLLLLARMASAVLPMTIHTLNRWAVYGATQRQLSAHASEPVWEWLPNPDPHQILGRLALAAVETLLHEDFTRVRQCTGCGWLFYDASKGNQRAWCDMRFCGNRAKNKRFQQRKKGE
jgi:predicted RNA-binding Zn ribbon-like protein